MDFHCINYYAALKNNYPLDFTLQRCLKGKELSSYNCYEDEAMYNDLKGYLIYVATIYIQGAAT